MRVLSHSGTHHLSGVYGRVRVPRNLDSFSATVLLSTSFLLISISRDEGKGEFL